MKTLFSPRSGAAFTAAAFLALGVVATTVATPAPAQAQRYQSGQNYGNMTFSAEIDGVTRVYIRGRKAWTDTQKGDNDPRYVRSSFDRGLPEEPVRLSVRRTAGRGTINLKQYPSEDNKWTAMVEIRDDDSGRDRYGFTLEWTTNGRGGGGGRPAVPGNLGGYPGRPNGNGPGRIWNANWADGNRHYGSGYRFGQGDARQGKENDWDEHWDGYRDEVRKDFYRGYRDGIRAASRDVDRASARTIDPYRSDTAYNAGYRFALRDYLNGEDDSAKRYEAYAERMKDAFRDGYRDGYRRDR
jgi:hypothetical protein